MQAFEDIPGPSQLPILGNALSFASKNRLQWMAGLSAQYGRLIRLRFLNKRVILLQDPQWIQYVLQKNYKNFSKKGRSLDKGRVILGNGLFTNEGESWRKQRKLAQPAFYKQKLEGIAQIMIDCIQEMLDNWALEAAANRPIDLAKEMMRLTLNVVTKAMFSSSLSKAEFELFAQTFPDILKETNRRILNPLTDLNIPTSKVSLHYERMIKDLDAIIYRMIEDRRQRKQPYNDLLGMLMSAVEEDGNTRMSEKQLRDEVMTIFLAGHETTAQALCWAFYLLHQHPAIQQQLDTEINAVLGQDPPTAADYRRLPYTIKVIKETLRLYPPVALYLRCTIQPFEMAGYHIPSETRFIIPPYMLHRDPAYWEQADRFDPERFSAEREKQRPKFVYFPFGGGPRICIGNNFAMMEAVFALSMIFQKFQVKLIAPEKVAIDYTLTLRPKNGMPAKLLAKVP
ncbi:MAG: cytochrome P450 [Bacteroidota bacterium]